MQVEVIEYTDDMTGRTIAKDEMSTIYFRWEGLDYKLDTTPKEVERMRKFMAKYTEKAQRVRADSASRAARRVAGGSKDKARKRKEKLDAMRQWAFDHGYIEKLNVRGRLAAGVEEAYDAAMASKGNDQAVAFAEANT